MKNTKILSIAVVLLLLTNIGLVAFMMTQKKKTGPKRPGGKEPSEMLVKETGMTEQQKKEYKQLKEEHFKNVRPLFDSIRSAKTAFYALTKDSTVNDSILNILSYRISTRQAELEKVTFAHFRKVRGIFSNEQKPKYDAFLQKMMQRGKRDSSAKKK